MRVSLSKRERPIGDRFGESAPRGEKTGSASSLYRLFSEKIARDKQDAACPLVFSGLGDALVRQGRAEVPPQRLHDGLPTANIRVSFSNRTYREVSSFQIYLDLDLRQFQRTREHRYTSALQNTSHIITSLESPDTSLRRTSCARSKSNRLPNTAGADAGERLRGADAV